MYTVYSREPTWYLVAMTNDINPATGLPTLPEGHFFRVQFGVPFDSYAYKNYNVSIYRRHTFLGIPYWPATRQGIEYLIDTETGYRLNRSDVITKEQIKVAATRLTERLARWREMDIEREARRKAEKAKEGLNDALLGDYPPKSVL